MKSLSFLRSAFVAFVLSLGASLIYFSTTMIFATGLAIQITISAVTFGYVLYLLNKTCLLYTSDAADE